MTKERKDKPSPRNNRGSQIDDLKQEIDSTNSTNRLVLMGVRLVVVMLAIMVFFWSNILIYLRNPTSHNLNVTALHIAIPALGLNIICVALVVIWRHVIQRGASYRHLRMRARRPLQMIVFSGFVAWCSLVVTFWPVYGVGSLFLFTFFAYALMCFLSFV